MAAAAPRYVLATVGSLGDVFPFLALGRALRALGRCVVMASNSVHRAVIEADGFPFIALGTDEDYHRIIANPQVWDPRRGLAVLMEGYRDGLTEIVQALRPAPGEAPAVVLAHPLVVPAAAAACELGLVARMAMVLLAPSNVRSCHDPLQLGPLAIPPWTPMWVRRALWAVAERQWIDPVIVTEINAARRSLQLPEIRSFFSHLAQAPDVSLTLFPRWYAAPAPDWPRPMLMGDFAFPSPAGAASSTDALPGDLAAFLDAGPAPLVFTPGTGNVHAARFFATAMEAVGRSGHRAVFLTRERSQVPAVLPPHVFWQPFVPMAALLARAAALVHHGGIGTTAEALHAGVPQRVVPFAYDQFDNGARVQALGVGLSGPASRLSARRLAADLRRLTQDAAIAARCRSVAEQCRRGPGLESLAGALLGQLEAPAAGGPLQA